MILLLAPSTENLQSSRFRAVLGLLTRYAHRRYQRCGNNNYKNGNNSNDVLSFFAPLLHRS